MKKKKYNTGGPISPNIQKLGNITFDSNTSRLGNDGEMIVKDIKTGKDYGVVRKTDGSYTWYTPKLGKRYKPEIVRKHDVASDIKKLSFMERQAVSQLVSEEDYATMNEVLDTLDYFSNNRVDGKMSKEEIEYRELLLDVEPFGYDTRQKVKDYNAMRGMSKEQRKRYVEKANHGSKYKERRAFYAKYLGLPYDETILQKSKDKPTSAKDKNTEYFTTNKTKERVVKEIESNYRKKSKTLTPHDDQLGNYTISSGKEVSDEYKKLSLDFSPEDEKDAPKTPYYSYYDKWDLDIPGSPISIDKYNYPFEIYGRIRKKDLKTKKDEVMNKYQGKYVGDETYFNSYAYGGKLDMQSKENINSILGAVSGIAPMFGPVGMGVGAAAMVGSNFLTNNIEKQKKGPHLANFTGYADGGKIKKTTAKRVSPMTPAEKQALAVEYGLKKDGTKGIEKTMEAIASLNPLSNTMSFLAKDEKNAMDYVSLIPGVKAASALGATANTLSKTSRQARNVRNAQTALRSLDYVDPVVPFIEGGKSHYATGGPVDPPNIQYVTLGDRKIKFDSNKGMPLLLGGKPLDNRYVVKDLDTHFYIDVDRDPITGAYSPSTGTIPRFNPDNIINNRSGGSGESSKSKSKDRFREMADGGFIGINSSSFKVDGDPNVKDSEFYAPKGVYLDDEEVVKNDSFVFSNRIKNPNTLRTFAKDAQRIEMATKRAEDKAKRYNDNISENTIKYNNMVVDKLAESQEFIATIKGLRNDSKMMANGGPFDPLPGQQFIEIYSGPNGVKQYYDPYNNRQVFRKPSTGTYFKAREDYPLPDKSVIDAHLKQYPGSQQFNQQLDNQITPFIPTTVKPTGPVAQTMSGYDPMTGVNKYDVGFNGPQGSGQPINLDPTTGIPTYTPPPATTSIRTGSKPTTKIPTKKVQPIAPTKPSFTDGRDLLDQSMYANNSLPFEPLPVPTLPNQINIAGVNPNTNPTLPTNSSIARGPIFPDMANSASNNYMSRFTPGDYMQMIAMGSRFLNIGSSEVDLPNLDTTNISKNSYDQAPVLQQNNRNYQNALNNTNTTSPNLRRALANQMYATKLQQDSNVMDQYQQMNNQANTDYENRLSNQNRFNAQQTSYTQDINARNRAALRNARQTAYDQIGVAGMMLNDKKQSNAYVQALKIRYPDIADNVLKDILNG